MTQRPLARFSKVAAIALMGIGLALGGCKSSKSSGYMDAYNAGNHEEAYKRASQASTSGSQEQREQASLVARASRRTASATTATRSDSSSQSRTPPTRKSLARRTPRSD
jgi:hypothetical protein